MFLKVLILIRQVPQRSVLFVTIDFFKINDLGSNHLSVMVVMIC